MRIGLVDVDGHNFPNLALMKLSAWHKLRGDTVEFADPVAGRYDKVYLSKVFTHTPDCRDEYRCEVIRGGTGYRDYTTTLPEAVEHTCPDYSLYGVVLLKAGQNAGSLIQRDDGQLHIRGNGCAVDLTAAPVCRQCSADTHLSLIHI